MEGCTNQEHAWLQLRIDELEDCLAEAQAEIRRLRGEDLAQADGGGAEHEGARLVVLEMLSSGYTRAQIVTYLRQTFAVKNPEVLVSDAASVAG